MPVWKQKYRPLTWPSPIGRMSRAAIPLASNCTAATGSLGMPSVRAKTFVLPPGSVPSAVVGAGHARGDLVERSVAAEADDDVDATAGRVLGEPDGVPAAIGLDDLDVVALGESPVHDHGVARRHRRGKRVDDQQDAQDSDDIGRARGWVPAVLRGNNGPP